MCALTSAITSVQRRSSPAGTADQPTAVRCRVLRELRHAAGGPSLAPQIRRAWTLTRHRLGLHEPLYLLAQSSQACGCRSCCRTRNAGSAACLQGFRGRRCRVVALSGTDKERACQALWLDHSLLDSEARVLPSRAFPRCPGGSRRAPRQRRRRPQPWRRRGRSRSTLARKATDGITPSCWATPSRLMPNRISQIRPLRTRTISWTGILTLLPVRGTPR